AGNPIKEILLELNLPDHRSILTDSKVTPTKHGRMTKPYSSPRFIANCFNAGYLKMEVKIGSCLNELFEDGVVKREEILQPTLEVEIARHACRGNWRRERRKKHVGLGHVQQSRSTVLFLTNDIGIVRVGSSSGEVQGK
ncbi:hypothetical protein Tco_1189201, partial [Tanacetum coccineum]